VRRLSALSLCLPALILGGIYAIRAYARIDVYRRGTGQEGVPIDLPMFQLALFDTLRVDTRRMSMPPPPNPSTLPVYAFQFERQDWETLERSGKLDGDRPYVHAKLDYERALHDVKVRLRGSRYWHTDLPQRSLKVKLDKGELVDGHRVWNLLNDPTPMVVGEHLILDLARELGALTPQSGFARVKINEKDQGVYLFETQPDESLLRNNRRIPGGVFSGDLPDSAKTSELWGGTKRWKKVSARTDSKEDAENMAELDAFLGEVMHASYEEFTEFARTHMNLEAFAAVDVLDVAFGGDQHDFRSNHKYYYDPYRARWEPIAWNFRGFRSDPRFNPVENPVLIRLLMTPDYLLLRDRMLYQFLMGEGTPAAVRERGVRTFVGLAPELRTDPFWDAYRMLSRVNSFYRRMVRPMDLERAALVFEGEITTYSARHAQLVRELEKNPLYLEQGPSRRIEVPLAAGLGEAAAQTAERSPAEASSAFHTPLLAVIDGRGGVKLRALRVEFGDDCGDRSFQLLRDGAPVTEGGADGEAELHQDIYLRPAVELFSRPDANARRGKVQTGLVPADYSFELISQCAPGKVELQGVHLATGSHVRSRKASAELLARVPQHWPAPSDVPALAVGQVMAHPASLEAAPAERIEFGPGEVLVAETRVLPANSEVVVHAGTTIHLAEGASLVFRGRVDFQGTAIAPITLSGTSGTWGGVALIGPGTRGSRLRHVRVAGGSTVTLPDYHFPAMVNIHDTSNIAIDDCRFSDNEGQGDAVHVAYVDDLSVEDSEFANTGGDGLDLEFVHATVSRVEFVNIGDDALDLMGTTVELADSVVLGAAGNGVSAGEESDAKVRSTLIDEAKVGVLAKNDSDVSLTGSVLFDNDIGVRVYTREVRYEGDSHVNASQLFVVGSKKKPIRREDRRADKLDQGRILESLPQDGNVDHLRDNVLDIGDWQELPEWVENRRRRVL
jgi:hypothetical protein